MKSRLISKIGIVKANVLNSPYRLVAARDIENVKMENKEVSEFEMNPVLVIFSLGLMILFLCVVSVLQFNANITKGYELKKLELKRLELAREASEINLKEANMRSMDRIIKSSQVDKMRKITQKSYVEPGLAVAKRN